MNFYEFIQEALKPSQFRQYVKAWKESGIARRYDEVFGNKDRIYEPIKLSSTFGLETSDGYKKVKMVLTTQFPKYTIENYSAGLVKNETGRVIKIGKLFSNTIAALKKEHDSISQETTDGYIAASLVAQKIKDIESAYQAFINDPLRSLGKQNHNLLICYSRHAYDIAGMSTDRGWTSCMNLETGTYKGYVEAEVTEGTIIAYLIKENDKNIQHPVARVLLKPFVNRDDGSWILLPAKLYGQDVPEFKQAVKKWADKNFNKNKYGIFTLNPSLYAGPGSVDKKTVTRNVPIEIAKRLAKEKNITVIRTAEAFIKWMKSDAGYEYFEKFKEFHFVYGNKNIDQIPPNSIWIKNNIKLSADDILAAYFGMYFKLNHDKSMIKKYHTEFNRTIMYRLAAFTYEAEWTYCVLSLYTVYDFQGFNFNDSSKVIIDRINYLLEKYDTFFYGRYLPKYNNKSLKKKLIADFLYLKDHVGEYK
jgi:hypothetical protein